jgi:hypothetical protein
MTVAAEIFLKPIWLILAPLLLMKASVSRSIEISFAGIDTSDIG